MSDPGKLVEHADNSHLSQMAVEKFMDRNPLTILDGSKLASAIKMLVTKNVSGAPVVDKTDKVVGFISEYDLLLQAATKDLAEPFSYTKDIVSLDPKAEFRDVLILFHKKKYRRIPVVNHTNHLLGVVSRHDILNKLIKSV